MANTLILDDESTTNAALKTLSYGFGVKYTSRGTNTNPTVGSYGEIFSLIASNATPTTITSSATWQRAVLSTVTAGDWDLWGIVTFTGVTGNSYTAISLVPSDAVGGTAGDTEFNGPPITASGLSLELQTVATVNAATNYYLNVKADFSGTTQYTYRLYARRAR